MKSRIFFQSLLVTLWLLTPRHLPAQDQPQPATNATDGAAGAAAPLQLQENPAPSPEGPGDAVPQPEASQAVPSPGEPVPPAPDSGQGSAGQNPPPSDPNSLIPPPTEPEQPSPINSGGNEEKARQEQKARYYSVKVKADKDEDLSSLQSKADKATSDEAKRQALRQYYDLLAKRMKKLDPSLGDWIDTMHAAYLRRLEQVRVEPSIPAELPPLAEGPSPSPKKKKKTEKSASGN